MCIVTYNKLIVHLIVKAIHQIIVNGNLSISLKTNPLYQNFTRETGHCMFDKRLHGFNIYKHIYDFIKTRKENISKIAYI